MTRRSPGLAFLFIALSLAASSCGSCDEALPQIEDAGPDGGSNTDDGGPNTPDGAPNTDDGGADGGPAIDDGGDGGPSIDDAGDGGPQSGDAGDAGPSTPDGGDGGPSIDDAGDGGGPPIADAGDGGPQNGDAGDAGPSTPDGGQPSTDLDCDGVSDAEELMLGTNPAAADSDLDGIIDGVELGRTSNVPGAVCPRFIGDQDPSTTTDPLSNDSDGDQLEDGLEDRNANGLRDSWETDAALADTDGDAILDGVEDRDHDGFLDGGESSPIFPDTDFDGLADGIEDADHDGLFDPTETNATLFDTDGDGRSDGCEDRDLDGTRDPGEADPRAADTDLDGIGDAAEDTNGNCTLDQGETDPSNSDTDCDALSDAAELGTTYAGGGRTGATVLDTDGDLLSDGVEAGATAAVPLSNCANVDVDLQPSTRTNPTIADTDGDGRSDGCEDRNRNGRRDGNEMDPLALDTDGDGLSDAAEDTNGNCVPNGGETNPTRADTDNDGIGDAIELGLGTNPTVADTDGDGIPDGVEDANQNGVVEPNETNPLVADTDGDGLADGTEDADRDGTVDPGESDPRDADTDGDGVNDGTEITNGTDPLDADSDDDNLSDGQESAAGTNPLDDDTDGDTVLDGDEVLAGTNPLDPTDPAPDEADGINTICSTAGLKVVSFYDHAGADTRVSLETSHTYGSVTVTGGDSAAAFGDNALGIAGFVLNIAPPAAGTNATTQAQALIARLTSGTALLGASAISVESNGRAITSHDGFAAVVDVRVALTLSAQAQPTVVRNRVMAVLSNHALADFTGLPPAGGANATTYVLGFEALVRTGPTRIIATGAVVAEASFDNPATVHRHQVEDLSNGTALARAYATNTSGCDPFTAAGTPRADFIWMADISSSTDNDRGTIATAADTIFTALQNNGVDFRMGVVPHVDNRINRGSAAASGDLRSGFTRDRNTFIADLNNTLGFNSCEFGLTAADDAINKALPRTAAGVENTLRLRSDAQLVVFYISDEHAQELENNQCSALNRGTGLFDIFAGTHEQSAPNATQQATINSLVQPFITNIQNQGGIAFAQIHPLQAPFCFVDFPTDEEEGYGYFEVVAATGGTFYRVCESNPGVVLQDIIDAVSGAASQYVLDQTPISSTIKVGLTRQGTTTTMVVPRSATDGFDYDPSANTVFFRGTAFRPVIGDRVTISYRIFGPPVPPVVCPPPLVLNAITNTCECPADCGVGGGCGAGRICDRDPAVCACECEPDCGGTCRGAFACDTTACGCACAPNCGGTCTGYQVCNQAACSCSWPADCGGNCTGNQVCDPASCACTCPTDCGGCPSGQVCDLGGCTCVAQPL